MVWRNSSVTFAGDHSIHISILVIEINLFCFESWWWTASFLSLPTTRLLTTLCSSRYNGSSDLSGTSGTRRRGSWDFRGTGGTRTRGLSTLTIPLVPNGTTKPRKVDAHLVDSLFWTINKFWRRMQFFFDIFERVWLCGFESTLRICEGKSHNIQWDKTRLSVQTQKQAVYSAFWAWTDMGHKYDNQWGPLLTKYLKCDARASTLLPETVSASPSGLVDPIVRILRYTLLWDIPL